MNFRGRLARAARDLEHHQLDYLLVTHPANVRYLCGFSGSAAALVLTRKKQVFFTDGRYREQASQEVTGCSIRIGAGSALAQAAKSLGAQPGARRVGIEAAHLTVADRTSVQKMLPKGARLIETGSIVEPLRIVKDADEISNLRNACQLGAQIFRVLLRKVRPGTTESAVAGQLELAARQAGAEQMSFPTIIAAGARSAMPHGRASGAVLPPKGFVVCDFGVILAGYCSDMTRTLHLGRPDGKSRQAYEAVQEAQQAALEAVRPGNTVGEVDLAARKTLKRHKLDKFFTHSTGHGVGLEIHEAPRVAAGLKDVLEPGMVITIEPGIYLPGRFGVRIEDTVVVTKSGCSILTNCSKELITL